VGQAFAAPNSVVYSRNRDSGLRRFGYVLDNVNVNANERGPTRRFGAASASTR
jgi:hypothetical protein